MMMMIIIIIITIIANYYCDFGGWTGLHRPWQRTVSHRTQDIQHRIPTQGQSLDSKRYRQKSSASFLGCYYRKLAICNPTSTQLLDLIRRSRSHLI